MANVQVSENTMAKIADAIRQKLNTVSLFKPSEMATAIESIENSESDKKKAGKIFTTALTSNPFAITASDQNLNRTLLERAFEYTGGSIVTNILSKLTSITFPATGVTAPTSMQGMFYDLPNVTNINLVGLDISDVTNMQSMCYSCDKLVSFDFGSVECSNVENAKYMFQDCVALTTINLGNFNLGNVSSLEYAFYSCKALSDISFINHKTYPNLVKLQSIFDNCDSLINVVVEDINLTAPGEISATDAFEACDNLETILLKDITVSNSESRLVLPYFVYGCPKLREITFNNVVVYRPIYAYGQRGLSNLTTINFGNSKLLNNANNLNGIHRDSNKLTTVDFGSSEIHGNLNEFFRYDSSLTTVNFGTSKLKLTSAYYMFGGCSSLTSIDFGDSLDIELTTSDNTLEYMFGGCSSLTSIDFGTSRIIQSDNIKNTALISHMFNGISTSHYIDFSNSELYLNAAYLFSDWSVRPNVVFGENNTFIAVNSMFANNVNLTSIDLSKPTINGNTSDMFYKCSALTTVIFNDNDIFTDTYEMFSKCTSLISIDLSNVAFVQNLRNNYMFYDCSSLTSIKLPESFTNISTSTTFGGLSSLQSLTFLSPDPVSAVSSSLGSYGIFNKPNYGYNEGLKIYVPYGCSEAQKASSIQSHYADIIYELP